MKISYLASLPHYVEDHEYQDQHEGDREDHRARGRPRPHQGLVVVPGGGGGDILVLLGRFRGDGGRGGSRCYNFCGRWGDVVKLEEEGGKKILIEFLKSISENYIR